jgi:hypothetical protein
MFSERQIIGHRCHPQAFPMFPPPSSYGMFAFDAMLIAARAAGQVCDCD